MQQTFPRWRRQLSDSSICPKHLTQVLQRLTNTAQQKKGNMFDAFPSLMADVRL